MQNYNVIDTLITDTKTILDKKYLSSISYLSRIYAERISKLTDRLIDNDQTLWSLRVSGR
jgi:hypothetical protein